MTPPPLAALLAGLCVMLIIVAFWFMALHAQQRCTTWRERYYQLDDQQADLQRDRDDAICRAVSAEGVCMRQEEKIHRLQNRVRRLEKLNAEMIGNDDRIDLTRAPRDQSLPFEGEED